MNFVTQSDTVKRSSRLQERTSLDMLKNRSRWLQGRTFNVVGYDVVKKDDNTEGEYLVLKTTVNGQPFDNLFLSLLIRPITLADGKEIEPNGSFNVLVKRLLDDPTIQTDEQFVQKIVEACVGKTIKCKRDISIKRMRRDGSVYPTTVCEFDII